MLFYLLFAICLGLRMSLLKFLTIALGLLAAAAIVIPSTAPAVFSYCHPIVLEFLYGVLLAYTIQVGNRLPQNLCWLLAAAGFIVLCSVPLGGRILVAAIHLGNSGCRNRCCRFGLRT